MESCRLKLGTRHSKRAFSLALATVALAAAVGCDSKNELPGILTQDTTTLAVVSTFPVNGAIGVTIGSAIRATFNEQADPTTLTAGTFQVGVSGGSAIDGVVTYDSASMTATFTPARLLAQRTAYTASLLGSIKDLRGNPLAARVDWTFTTATLTARITEHAGNRMAANKVFSFTTAP